MITPEMIEYAERHTTPELPVLERLNRETNLTQLYPRMMAGHLQGTFLRMVSEMIKPKRILEIGTFTGYSTINLASGLEECSTPGPFLSGEGRCPTTGSYSQGVLHTIEVNPELEDIIRKYIREAGLEARVILHIGDAMEVVPKLNEDWDLVYIDADKPNYLNYYRMVMERLRPGGFLLADNAFWDGKVLEDRSKLDKETLGIVEFNEFVQTDPCVGNMLLPLRDGIMMMRKL